MKGTIDKIKGALTETPVGLEILPSIIDSITCFGETDIWLGPDIVGFANEYKMTLYIHQDVWGEGEGEGEDEEGVEHLEEVPYVLIDLTETCTEKVEQIISAHPPTHKNFKGGGIWGRLVQFYSSDLDVQRKFDNLAHWILSKLQLVCRESRYRVGEIEFYLYDSEHRDPYVHCHVKQLEFATFYFHREKSAKIGFTLKGMDITFGGGSTYGGILIRSLITETGEVIEGPSKVVDRILIDFGVTAVLDLKEHPRFTERDEGGDEGGDDVEVKIKRGPRVGLNKEKDPAWVDKPYRYVSCNVKRDKTKLN
jgi:hypothetical protein